jgi:hypothetical protein
MAVWRKRTTYSAPGVLVQLIFDGHATERNLYESVDLLWWIATGCDIGEIHGLFSVHRSSSTSLLWEFKSKWHIRKRNVLAHCGCQGFRPNPICSRMV